MTPQIADPSGAAAMDMKAQIQAQAQEPVLRLEDVHAGYGEAQVLFGVDLEVPPSAAVGLIGRNGMGKTTLIKAVCGLIPLMRGTILFAGRPIHEMKAHKRARLGIGLVPEGRQIFPTLTVQENLLVAARATDAESGRWTPETLERLFPELASRRNTPGALLSGGEQQMLAIARALMTHPRLLILDEATEGLAPRIRQRIHDTLAGLKGEGLSLLVVDHDIQALAGYCDLFVIMEKGRIVWQGEPAHLLADESLQHRHLGLGQA